jgi:Haem degrading protein HbpS-like
MQGRLRCFASRPDRLSRSAQQLTQMQGALPIVVNGETVGAVGISADTPVHDQKIATATLRAVVCLTRTSQDTAVQSGGRERRPAVRRLRQHHLTDRLGIVDLPFDHPSPRQLHTGRAEFDRGRSLSLHPPFKSRGFILTGRSSVDHVTSRITEPFGHGSLACCPGKVN